MDDLASFFSFFFWPPMVIGEKDAEVRAVAAEVGPRDIGGGAESKSDAANEAEKDDGNGAAGTNEGTSAEKSTDAPPATDEALVKDSITRWLDDMGVELFFKTESPGAATYRFDMRVTDDPGPFSTVQMLLRFSGAWVYADATPRVYFPKSRRSEVMNAIAQESGRISYTSIHWSEERRCYTARAVLPASAVVRDTDSSLKWLLDRAGEAANEIGGRLAQFLTEEEPLPGVPCGTPPGSPSLLDESGRLALFAGFTQEDAAANEAERRADPEMPMTRNSLFLRVRNEDGEDAWRLLLTSGSDWRGERVVRQPDTGAEGPLLRFQGPFFVGDPLSPACLRHALVHLSHRLFPRPPGQRFPGPDRRRHGRGGTGRLDPGPEQEDLPLRRQRRFSRRGLVRRMDRARRNGPSQNGADAESRPSVRSSRPTGGRRRKGCRGRRGRAVRRRTSRPARGPSPRRGRKAGRRRARRRSRVP